MKQTSLLANRWRVLSGSWLKVLAMVSMLCDHIAYVVLRFAEHFTVKFPFEYHDVFLLYSLLRNFGRLAFPLFAFLMVEGFIHTHSRLKYGLCLLLFGLLSIIPWSLAFFDCFLTLHTLNIFFTLLLGLIALSAIERWEKRNLSGLCLLAVLILLLTLAHLFHTDYETAGVGFIISLYILRANPALQAVIGISIIPVRWKAGLAFIPINLYNGRRGFIKGPIAKYAFYAFYPIHLLLLYFIREVLMA